MKFLEAARDIGGIVESVIGTAILAAAFWYILHL